MIDYIIPLLECYLTSSWVDFWFFPLLALAFVPCVPALIRQFWR